MAVMDVREGKVKRQTSFPGSDDGLALLGVVFILLVILLLLPAVARKAAARYQAVLKQYEEVMDETY